MLMHRLPPWVHRMETYATFVHESFCALFVFAPWYLRIVAFAGFESLMLIINLTGQRKNPTHAPISSPAARWTPKPTLTLTCWLLDCFFRSQAPTLKLAPTP